MVEGSACYKECWNKHADFILYVQMLILKAPCVQTLCNKISERTT